MTDNGYLSLDKAHLAKMQRERRASIRRIDYTPSRDALAAFEARQTQERPGSIAATNSAVLDAIVTEWAELTGIKKQEVEAPKTPKGPPEFMHQYARTRMSPAAVRFGPGPVEDSGNAKRLAVGDRSARAQDFDRQTGINGHIAGARVGAYESGHTARSRHGLASRHASAPESRHAARAPCGARRHRDGQPCQAKSEPGKRRCRFHGGRSTGPTSEAGKARALANLRQYQKAERRELPLVLRRLHD
ncbi:HGGxSTG domain-containing protein [Xanthomonas hortorum pv. vitians]|uniref:HGGxSTG domain-containing protein n=3 Tax=Xanthomonas hortorum TaxID=56454 RepID=A0A6V7F1V1_9XANT|nr:MULTISPECIES: HGGxSTG domain-containing protein [Xanthomonas]MCC8495413.1 hypothetical protein [Xanthomonas hortorum pv. gardneri]MCC8554973.1 hypothetical protein [Xanthomonas hortorum pv. gardneri]MCE4281574.1 hypothetical protein [Xanthomonas hortorum pv. vitians]MCE4285186.1 hypothetical protein [Xanthomonas hortorum pv. vitians]MCE4290385.1 hypothetical protein [Xanthomonas hortorum pv. vitians]